jgi:nucleotide-binding universal stress UspA family protein
MATEEQSPTTFRNVVVGVDGGPAGRDAIALAHRLAEPGGTLTLVNVQIAPVAYGPAGPVWADADRERSQRLLERERTAHAPEARTTSPSATTAGEGLHRVAEQIDADLLVVGSSARGAVGRVLLGDDAHAALNGAPCAVATAPRDYADRASALERIGVGYDGSPESEAALAAARELAARTGARVDVVGVVGIPAMYGPVDWGVVLDGLEQETHQRLDSLEGVEHTVVRGDPGEALVALGERVQLLIVGSRAYGPVRRLVLGSTSAYLQRHAPCPLLVLPRTALATHRHPAVA